MPDGKTVLFVEDNPEDVELTLLAFEEEGFRHPLVVARDGQEALDYLFARGAHAGRDRTAAPVLVVLDLKLPKIGGLEVLKAMRNDRLLRYVVAVILTTSDEERDKVEAQRLGANLYIRKPMSFDELRAVARRIAGLIP